MTVGAGGHALYAHAVASTRSLEAVQTTRDLSALAVDADGAAWAGAAQARLLRAGAGALGADERRRRDQRPRVVALWAAPRSVRAVCDDGAVIEGRCLLGHG